jgi:hypothetical protein
MHPISQVKKSLISRKVGRLVALLLMIGALTAMPLNLRSATTIAAAGNPPPCYQQASTLGQIINHITLCWNGFTGEFEIYVSPVTGTTGGQCGSAGATPVSCTGGTAHRPPNLPNEIHIVPDNPTPPPGTTISITILFQYHKKPVPLTPLEYQATFNFDSKAVMDLPSHCTQLFP